jgi:protein disulfide-isomerase
MDAWRSLIKIKNKKNNTMKKLLVVLLVALSINGFAQQKELVWHTDVNKAINISIETGKPLLFFFTGKDWCPPCKMTAKYVFGSIEFANWSNKLILVELDFPRKEPARKNIPAEQLELAKKLEVRSYPTVWFIGTSLKDNQIELKQINKIVGGSRDTKSWINQANKILENK